MPCQRCQIDYPVLYKARDFNGWSCPNTHVYCYGCFVGASQVVVTAGSPVAVQPTPICDLCDRVGYSLIPLHSFSAPANLLIAGGGIAGGNPGGVQQVNGHQEMNGAVQAGVAHARMPNGEAVAFSECDTCVGVFALSNLYRLGDLNGQTCPTPHMTCLGCIQERQTSNLTNPHLRKMECGTCDRDVLYIIPEVYGAVYTARCDFQTDTVEFVEIEER